MADDFEFDDDDIDWSSIPMPDSPVPTVTPSNKRPRLDVDIDEDKNNAADSSTLLSNLEIAPTYDVSASLDVDGPSHETEDKEVGDSLQLKAIELAKSGESVFLTGKAGTGKSWATERIVKCFERDDKVIHVTAPTGIAAINIGGMTIHHWRRFRLGQHYEDFNSMMSEHTMHKIRKMDALLIDEISMLDGHLFDVLECMISIIRHYDDILEKLTKIKEEAGNRKNIMSETMLQLRWDTISDLGLSDIPPFGGLQLIVVGDFYQLPPVPAGYDVLMENKNLKEVDIDLKIGRQGSYAFESHAWHRGCLKTVELTEVHRQAEKDGLFEFLNAVREGKPDLVSKHQKTLTKLQSPLPERNDGIIPTELHSKNYVVDRRNRDELLKLPGNLHEFVSMDEVGLSDEYKEEILTDNNLLHLRGLSIQELIDSRSLPRHVSDRIKYDLRVFGQYAQEQFFERDCRVAHNIELKIDAQVMLLWNLEFKAKLANGSRGVVKGMFPVKGYYFLIQEEIQKREEERCCDEDDASYQESKDLAISDQQCEEEHTIITPHKKSQDSSKAIIQKKLVSFDFSGINPEFVKEIKDNVANMGQTVLDKERQEMMKVLTSDIVELPYIHFVNGKRRLILPQPFSKEFKGVGTAIRWQIPLTLAWAISIHKSQGMTIEFLQVDLADCFAIGQAYVACSRGKCLNSMSVRHFKPTEIKTSEKVMAFYKSVNSGKPYTGGVWSDTIAAFDEDAKQEIQNKKEMRKHYSNVMPCGKCGTMCVVGQVKSTRNNNQGKYFISCPGANGESGHTWELVNTLPLRKRDNVASNGNQAFKFLTPGVGGTIAGRLEDKRFVVTGVFPELGGGFGLKLGRDKMKEMIECFGGKVTGSISGKTHFVIVGDEPGDKRLEQAKSKGVPIIDRTSLHKILVGEGELPSSGKDDSQTTSIKSFFKTEEC